MNWIILVIAGLLEVAWATGMKYSEGFTRLWWSVGTLIGMAASFALLSIAMKHMPLGTAYTVWTGIGAVGSVIVGIALMGESREPLRLLCVAFIIGGIIGLKMLSK